MDWTDDSQEPSSLVINTLPSKEATRESKLETPDKGCKQGCNK